MLLPAGKDAKAVAAKAAAAVKKNTWAKTRKPRYSVVFHRPKTLKRTRDPKYTRKRWVSVRSLPGVFGVRQPPSNLLKRS